MRIEYRGKSEEQSYRCADITYDEKKEQALADQVVEKLEKIGRTCYEDEEIITVIVSDKKDFNTLVKDYMEIKRSLK